jgi:hypothetical protein
MRLKDIILEAKGPAKISTGGKGFIANPAHARNVAYEGDPAYYRFEMQQKNYDKLLEILKRNGLKFEYLAAAIAPSGLMTFVVTAPGLVWYRYGANNPVGAQNVVYVRGVKMNTSSFVGMSTVKQDHMLSNKTNTLDAELVADSDVAAYIKRLLTSGMSSDEIENKLIENKDKILDILNYCVSLYIGYADPLKCVNDVITIAKKHNIKLPWLDINVFRQKAGKKVTEQILYDIPTSLDGAASRLELIINKKLPIDTDAIIDKLNKNKNKISKRLANDVLRWHDMSPIKKLKVFCDLGVSWLDIDVLDLNKLFNDEKRNIIVSMLSNIKRTTEYSLSDILRRIQTLREANINWPELDAIESSVRTTLANK